MKKTVIVALALTLCFTLTAYAANIFTLGIDSINTAVEENETVIYTPSHGGTLSGEGKDYSFSNHYVVTVIPRILGSDVSEDVEGGASTDSSLDSSIDSSVEIPPVTSEQASEEVTSEGTFPIVSEGGSVAETAAYRESAYKYKVEKVYAPGTAVNNVSVPENGFILVFPSLTDENSTSVSEESALGRNVTASDIEAGAPVAVYGVDFTTNTLENNAYFEIDLSGKGLLGDVPQTSDSGIIITLTVIAVIAAAGAAFVYRKRTV